MENPSKESNLSVIRGGKVESAGKQVMEHIIELTKTTDLSCFAMSKRINEIYGLELNRYDVYNFFNKNAEIIERIKSEKSTLSQVRRDLVLEHVAILIKDIRTLDDEIDDISGAGGKMIEPDKRANTIANLIDKKGLLLLREARLSGKLHDDRSTKITKIDQVNILVDTDKSDIIKKIKSFDKENLPKVIDVKAKVTPHENKKSNP